MANFAYLRYAVGRFFIHLGINVLPRGRTRALIVDKLLDVRFEIEDEIARSKGQ